MNEPGEETDRLWEKYDRLGWKLAKVERKLVDAYSELELARLHIKRTNLEHKRWVIMQKIKAIVASDGDLLD